MNIHLLIRHKFASLITGVLLLPMLFMLSCDDPGPDPEPELEEVLTEEGTFFPYEIAQLSLQGEKIGMGKIEGTLNDQPVEIHLFDTVMVFSVPDIAPGVYTLEAPHEGKMLTSTVTVKELALTSSPDQIFQEIVQEDIETKQRLTADAESRSEPDKARLLKDIQTLNGWMSNLEKHYAALSPEGKQGFAKTVVANKWWLDQLHTAVIRLSINAKSLRKSGEVEDYETRVWDAAQDLIEAKDGLFSYASQARIALGAVVTGVVGATILASSPVVGAAVGVAVGVAAGSAYLGYKFSVDYTEFNDALNTFYDTVVEPFMDDEFYSERLAAPEIITFVSKEAKELDTYSNYRSPYSQDKGSSTPMMKTLSGASDATEALWEDFSPSLPSPLQPPQTLDDIESYSTTQRAVHSNYLEVSDISNDDVKLIKKEDKDGRLVLTFENKTATVQKFTYKLTYANNNFSSGFSKTISSEVLPSMSIVGKWQVKSNTLYTYDKKGGKLISSEEYFENFHYLEFTSDNKVLFYWGQHVDNEVRDSGSYTVNTEEKSVIIFNAGDDEFEAKYDIVDYTPEGFVMRASGQHEDGTFVVLEITLVK